MIVERHYSNTFPKSEDAHAFEQHVTGAALEAGLSVGASGVEDLGLPGYDARVSLTGESADLDRFAAELHRGARLHPADRG